jgi:DNA repair exonuclease SbcCD ATPase subunit
MHITFTIERDGETEDILTGQGGSVCNVISVGLRLIALSQLDEKQHRRFLVLDEQDCWLRPDLVPRLMAIIHKVARKLQFQVLVISHHSVDIFREHADRIYRVLPSRERGDGVKVELLAQRAPE